MELSLSSEFVFLVRAVDRTGKRFGNAVATIAGIELMHRLRKGQLFLPENIKYAATLTALDAVLPA
jgi:hypothetical protein